MALAQHRVRHAVGGHPGTRRFQRGLALFQGQPVALGVQVRQFGEQGLPGAQAQLTAEVGLAGAFCSRVSGLVQNVQQHQRRVEAAGGPGGVVANRVRGGGAVDTGNHMAHSLVPLMRGFSDRPSVFPRRRACRARRTCPPGWRWPHPGRSPPPRCLHGGI